MEEAAGSHEEMATESREEAAAKSREDPADERQPAPEADPAAADGASMDAEDDGNARDGQIATAGGSAAAGQSAAADNDSQPIGLHCQNPAQIRAWEVARATDVSAAASPSVVTGARFTLAGNNSAALQLSCKLCHLD